MAEIWVYVGIYIAAVLLVGFLTRKKGDDQQFFIANRNLGFIDSLSSITASKIATGVVTTYAALVFVFGVGAMTFFVGWMFGYILFYFYAKKLRLLSEKNGFYTLGDYFKHRFGPLAGKVIGVGTFVSYLAAILIQLIGGSKILSLITGLSYPAALLILGVSVLVYLYVGGFFATVRTDTLQYIAMVVLFGIITVLLSNHFVYVPSDWTFTIGAGDAISFLIAGLLIPLSTVDLYQRVFAARSLPVVRNSIMGASAFFLLIGGAITFMVLVIKGHLTTVIDPDVVLVEGFFALLPEAFIGLGVIALFAVIMSSSDTYAYTAAAIATHDLTTGTPREQVRTIKRLIVVLLITGMIVSLLFPSVIDASYLYVGIMMVISILVLWAWIHKNASQKVIVYGGVFGLSATLFYALFVSLGPTIALVGILCTLIGCFAGHLHTHFYKPS